MRIDDIKKVKPSKDNVVIRRIEPDKADGLYLASESHKLKNAELSYSEVLAVGPTATQESNCPGLKVGDKVVHNKVAGSYISTDDLKELYKVLGGYQIMAILDDLNNLNESTIRPTTDRLLIAVKFRNETNSGLFIPEADAKNPQLEDLGFGVVISVGPSCKLGYKPGDLVGYQPFCGEEIRRSESANKPELRVLNEDDVLLSI